MCSADLCPNFAGFSCQPWPDKIDTSYPPLIQFRLSDLSPATAKVTFNQALTASTVIDAALGIYIDDAVFRAAVRHAKALCAQKGIHTEPLMSAAT